MFLPPPTRSSTSTRHPCRTHIPGRSWGYLARVRESEGDPIMAHRPFQRRAVLPMALTIVLAASLATASPASAAHQPKPPPPLTPVTTNRYEALPAVDVMVPTRG